MLQSLLNGDSSALISLLLSLPAVLIALSVHEAAHGYAAYLMGDNTARSFGRITMNPLRHIDPIGTLCMVFFGFGWAKPVPFNPRNFKNYRKGTAITALAGPLSNLIMGAFGVLLNMLSIKLLTLYPSSFTLILEIFTYLFAMINFGYAIFNMIPIPPFDGSRVLFVILPDKYYFGIMKYERFIMIGLLLCLYTGIITIPLSAARDLLFEGFYRLFSLIPFLG